MPPIKLPQALLIACVALFLLTFSFSSEQPLNLDNISRSTGTQWNIPEFIRDLFTGHAENDDYSTVTVHFATNRKKTEKDGHLTYSTDTDNLSYGYCDVSIPVDHRVGILEEPQLRKLEFAADPNKHVVLLSTRQTSREEFLENINGQIGTTGSNAFVFVHGFNVSFEDAARRTAQMAYDLKFDGAPVFFSWPSQAKLTAYTVDERNIEWAETDLRVFLTDFLKHSQADNIYVIGHSMGTRALARSIAAIGISDPSALHRLKGVILAAPDIDAAVFKRDIAPRLIGAGRNVTLYASSNDKALQLSKKVHGYQRAGETGDGLVLLQGMDTIDASAIDTSLLGHSYYGENRSIISDLYYLLRNQTADNRMGLKVAGLPPEQYWKFQP